MTREALRQVLSEAVPVEPPPPPVQRYTAATATAFSVRVEDLLGRTQRPPVVDARHVVMALLYADTSLSLTEIGDEFDRDHTTVLASIRRVQTTPQLASWAAAVRKTIEEGDDGG